MKKSQGFRRPHRIKRKRSIIKSRFFWLGILISIIIGGSFYLVCFSSFFQVKEIEISGNQKVLTKDLENVIENQIIRNLFFFQTKSIFLVNLNKIKKALLSNFFQIAEAEIHRGFPDALDIIVIERFGLAIWCRESRCFLLDNEGIIFEEIQTEENSIKIIDERNSISFTLGDKVIEKEKLNQIMDIVSKIRDNLKIQLKEISIVSEERLNVKTSEDWEIYFDLEGDINWQLTKLSLVLEEKILPEQRENLEYIDLRFNRVYYK